LNSGLLPLRRNLEIQFGLELDEGVVKILHFREILVFRTRLLAHAFEA